MLSYENEEELHRLHIVSEISFICIGSEFYLVTFSEPGAVFWIPYTYTRPIYEHFNLALSFSGMDYASAW